MNELPTMQIRFIDSICAPIYTAFAKLFPHELGPLLDGCLSNRALWTEMATRSEVPSANYFATDDAIAADKNESPGLLSTNISSKSETDIHQHHYVEGGSSCEIRDFEADFNGSETRMCGCAKLESAGSNTKPQRPSGQRKSI